MISRDMSRIIFICIIALMATGTYSQKPMSLYFMETIPQTTRLNPAMQPRANFYFSLFSTNQLFQSDLAFKDVFQESGNDHVTLTSERFDFNKLYNTIGSTAFINSYTDIGLLGFGFKAGKGYFTFALSQRSAIQSGIPADMFKIIESGFPDNTLFELSTLRQKGLVYKEISFGYSHQVNDKLTVGVNLKPLFGQVAFMTDIEQFNLYTSRHSWEAGVNGNIYTSLPLEVEYTPGEFPTKINARDLDDSDVTKYLTSFSNPGLATDLGAVYKFNGQWTFSAALNNLGFINWHEDLNHLKFDGSYIFEGVSVDATNKNNISSAFNDIIDSLKTVINYNTSHQTFSSGLTPSFYLGASYHLNHAISVGLLSRSTLQKHNFRQDFSLSANLQPYSFASLNLNLSHRLNGSTFVGLGVMFLMGPLQLYLLTDHLPFRYSDVDIDGARFPVNERLKDASIMFGINFVFGRHGKVDKPLLQRCL